MSLQYRVWLVGSNGEEVEKTLTFETASSVTLHGLKQQLGFHDKEGELQLFNPAYSDFQTLKSEKDIAILKNDSKFKILKKVTKKELKKEKENKEKKEHKEKKDKKKDKKVSKNEKKESSVFGIDLAELADKEPEGTYIPRFVTQTVEWLQENGLKEEGLFRISGGTAEVEELKREYEKGEEVDLSGMAPSVSAVAGLLKYFFRELPQPVIVYRFYTTVVKIAKTPDVKAQVGTLRVIFAKLPDAHRSCLVYLLKFLKEVSKYSETNKMSSTNLATVWAPNLVREPPEMDPMTKVLDANDVNAIVTVMIREADSFTDLLTIQKVENTPEALARPVSPNSMAIRERRNSLTQRSQELAERKLKLKMELSKRIGDTPPESSGGGRRRPVSEYHGPNSMNDALSPTTGRKKFNWILDALQREELTNQFKRLDTDKDGFIAAAEARSVFSESNLELNLLGRIWDLADETKDTKLDLNEFLIAMFLVNAKLEGQELPVHLPASLKESVYKKTEPASPVVLRSATLRPTSKERSEKSKSVNTQNTDFRNLLKKTPVLENKDPVKRLSSTISGAVGRKLSVALGEPPVELPVHNAGSSLVRVSSSSPDFKRSIPLFKEDPKHSSSPSLSRIFESPAPSTTSPEVGEEETPKRRTPSRKGLKDSSPWREALSPDGRTYFYNKKTKETSWKAPEGFIPGLKTPVSPPPENKKPEWKVATAANGKTYYYNTITKQTSWRKPADFQNLSEIFDKGHQSDGDVGGLKNSDREIPLMPDDKSDEEDMQQFDKNGVEDLIKKEISSEEDVLKREEEELLELERQEKELSSVEETWRMEDELKELERQERELLEESIRMEMDAAQKTRLDEEAIRLEEEERLFEEEQERLRAEEDDTRRARRKTLLEQKLKELDSKEESINRMIQQRSTASSSQEELPGMDELLPPPSPI